MPRFDAVLFDNGNTLFYRTSPIDSIVELARQRGVSVTDGTARLAWQEVKEAKRKAKREGGPDHRLERNASSDAHRRFYLRQYAPLDDLVAGMAELFYDGHKTSPRTMVPYPDTEQVLCALRDAGVRIGIVSNTGWDISKGYERAGLAASIDVWVLSWQHGTAKPNSRLFTHACEQLGVDPTRTLMVGNDAEADGGAADVGCTCLVLPEVGPGQRRGLDHVLQLVGVDAAVTASMAYGSPPAAADVVTSKTA